MKKILKAVKTAFDFILSLKIDCGCRACSYKLDLQPMASIPSVIENKNCSKNCKECKCNKNS